MQKEYIYPERDQVTEESFVCSISLHCTEWKYIAKLSPSSSSAGLSLALLLISQSIACCTWSIACCTRSIACCTPGKVKNNSGYNIAQCYTICNSLCSAHLNSHQPNPNGSDTDATFCINFFQLFRILFVNIF